MSNNVAIFTPKGEKAQWELIYEVLKFKQVNEVLTYEELDDILGYPFKTNRTPLYQAQKHLERHNLRTIAVVPKVGYRVVDAAEHADLASKHQKRGRRQLKKAIDKIVYVDRGRLTPEAIRRFDAIQVTLTRQEEMIRRQDVRMANIEKAVQETRQLTAKSTEELAAKQAKMLEALKRAGIAVDDTEAESSSPSTPDQADGSQ